MAHEKSITKPALTREGIRWFNYDTVGPNAGTILGSKSGYATVGEAVAAAKRRSDAYIKPATSSPRLSRP